MQRERITRIYSQRISVLSALCVSGKVEADKLIETMRSYVDLELLSVDISENKDKSLHQEYELVKNMNVLAQVNRDGVLEVEGIYNGI